MTDQSRSLRLQFGLQFVQLSRRWRQAINDELAKIGFSDAVWTPLFYLARFGDGISQKDLAGRAGLDTSSLVRILDILERDGQVSRVPDEKDRRSKRIVLTEKGRDSFVRIQSVLATAETELLSGLNDGEVDVMLMAFSKINQKISK